jgi:hypothetical protein
MEKSETNVPYTVIRQTIPLKNFWQFDTDYRLRLNYFRVNQWTAEQQQSFIDNVFRQVSIQPITLRKINAKSNIPLSPNESIFEIIDGWQRIKTIQDFLNDKIQLPQSLENCRPFHNAVPCNMDGSPSGCSGLHNKLPKELKTFIQETLTLKADVVIGIDDIDNVEHEKLASSLFLELHQGEYYPSQPH